MDDYDVRIFGRRVRALRESRKMTLREVERGAGVSNARLSQLETGKAPDLGVVLARKLARFFGVSVDYLLGDADPRSGAYRDGLARAEERVRSWYPPEELAGTIGHLAWGLIRGVRDAAADEIADERRRAGA